MPTNARTDLTKRRLGLALAVLAACVAIVIAVTAIGRDGTFVDRAHAAVTASGLFHVVEEGSVDAPPVVFKNEPFEETPRRSRTEAWYDRSDNASHFIVYARRDGRWVPDFETAWKDGKSLSRWGADGSVSEASKRPTEYYAVSLFEEAYREDKVRDDGELTVDGRRLRRLVLDVPPAQGAPGPTFGSTEQVMLFDPATLYPVRLTQKSSITIDGVEHAVKTTTRYRTFESLPETPENLAKLDLR